MTFPVAGHLHRIDRINQIAGGQQRLNPRAPFGLDPDNHLIGLTIGVEMLGHQLVQGGDAGQAIRQSPPDQKPARVILELDVVVGLSPIVADEQHSGSPSPLMINTSLGVDLLRPNGSVLNRHDIPPALPASSPTSRGTTLVIDLNRAWGNTVLTGGRARTTACRKDTNCCSPITRNACFDMSAGRPL